MKILYSGPLKKGSLTEGRRKGMADLGHEIIPLDQVPYLQMGPRWWRKFQLHLLLGPGIRAYNRDLLQMARESRADMIYIDAASYLWPETVRELRNCTSRLISFTSEYFGFRRYWYRHFLKTVALYDAHILTHPPSRKYLEERGVKKIVMTEFGYNPELHRPPALTPEEKERYRSDAVFVGHWEPATESRIRALREAGIDARVWGPGWHRARSLEDRNQIRPAVDEEYVRILAASRIGLGFLSTWNNGQSNSRTFEIPAVGQFLLMQRTSQTVQYYVENEEAVFFSDTPELVEKARSYLKNDHRRLQIARAGHERSLRSGYTHRDRVRRDLEAIG